MSPVGKRLTVPMDNFISFSNGILVAFTEVNSLHLRHSVDIYFLIQQFLLVITILFICTLIH